MANFMLFFAPGGAAVANIKTGTYTGDGSDNRTVDIGVNLSAKSCAYVIIKGNVGQSAQHRIEYGQGDLAMWHSASVDLANRIQGFNNVGFQVGSSLEVNSAGTVYRYIVFWKEP